ncbi:cyclin-dependent protein kinase, PHO85 homologue, putative [Theileria annulata]|uniref:Cyclin-dependent kinase 2 homolog n=1 Tax=Theileria annulata TaxID=5874 RepID=Q4UE22_THEAN|nr:cyclin-dependent protein kinase, PHO85 homologue, putative [Theileria annulata]CAI74667.1 cyclin-dependent protein kinase, PHO85 homologue, putative [Theileria annulata]|eukprot:XP_952399.1 cyclin-dependent protein kinase, PHO85 homologue, putative [Theileria annulata]
MSKISLNNSLSSNSGLPYNFDNQPPKKNSFSTVLDRDDHIFDDAVDNYLSKYDNSSSYIDSYDPNWFRIESNLKAANIADLLTFSKKIGKGVYGDVFLCYLRNEPSKRFAVKRVKQATFPVINIFGLEQNTIKELHALRSLKRPHTNIVRLYDYCSAIENSPVPNPQPGQSPSETSLVFYLIFELCDMDLSNFIKENNDRYKDHQIDLITCVVNQSKTNDFRVQDIINYSQNVYLKEKVKNNTQKKGKIPLPGLEEDIAKVIMYQILQGLAYLHSNRIIHRDIKPQNILLKNLTPITDYRQVKIADLGLSTIVPARYLSSMTEEVITLLYRPPELLLGDCKYTTSVDIWSAAVTVGECLLGKPMFRGRTEFSVLMRIISTVGCSPISEVQNLSKQFKYLTESIPHIERDPYDSLRKIFTDHFGRQLISETGLDLFVKMLKFLPSDRITAKEALKHAWFSDVSRLLKPSVVKKYQSNENIFPRGYNDMMPLTFMGNVEEFKKKIRKKQRLDTVSVDSYVTQFTFP